MEELIAQIRSQSSELTRLFRQVVKGERASYEDPVISMNEHFSGYISYDVGCMGHWETEKLAEFDSLEELSNKLAGLINDYKFQLLDKELKNGK